jgi:hypothetical protein
MEDACVATGAFAEEACVAAAAFEPCVTPPLPLCETCVRAAFCEPALFPSNPRFDILRSWLSSSDSSSINSTCVGFGCGVLQFPPFFVRVMHWLEEQTLPKILCSKSYQKSKQKNQKKKNGTKSV